jgi:hypothetical protein
VLKERVISRLRCPGNIANAAGHRRSGFGGAVVALMLVSGCVSATPDWRGVRVVRERVDVTGCTLLTILKDEDMEDLRKRQQKRAATPCCSPARRLPLSRSSHRPDSSPMCTAAGGQDSAWRAGPRRHIAPRA